MTSLPVTPGRGLAAKHRSTAPQSAARLRRMGASRDPLHGVTLEKLLTALVAACGWEGLAREVDIRCFRFDPSIKSSLQFLRRTPWARTKVEQLYVRHVASQENPRP